MLDSTVRATFPFSSIPSAVREKQWSTVYSFNESLDLRSTFRPGGLSLPCRFSCSPSSGIPYYDVSVDQQPLETLFIFTLLRRLVPNTSLSQNRPAIIVIDTNRSFLPRYLLRDLPGMSLCMIPAHHSSEFARVFAAVLVQTSSRLHLGRISPH
jgi:hypothetical protein